MKKLIYLISIFLIFPTLIFSQSVNTQNTTKATQSAKDTPQPTATEGKSADAKVEGDDEKKSDTEANIDVKHRMVSDVKNEIVIEVESKEPRYKTMNWELSCNGKVFDKGRFLILGHEKKFRYSNKQSPCKEQYSLTYTFS